MNTFTDRFEGFPLHWEREEQTAIAREDELMREEAGLWMQPADELLAELGNLPEEVTKDVDIAAIRAQLKGLVSRAAVHYVDGRLSLLGIDAEHDIDVECRR